VSGALETFQKVVGTKQFLESLNENTIVYDCIMGNTEMIALVIANALELKPRSFASRKCCLKSDRLKR